jgi:hypothetical protein
VTPAEPPTGAAFSSSSSASASAEAFTNQQQPFRSLWHHVQKSRRTGLARAVGALAGAFGSSDQNGAGLRMQRMSTLVRTDESEDSDEPT